MRHFALMHRFSSFACAALAAVLLQPGLASAVVLGNIALQSSLGQPLRVAIPVALGPAENINNSCFKLVANNESGAPQLTTGSVNLERNASGARLVVTTRHSIDEPAVRISLQAGCDNTVRRDYVLLLDPQGSSANTMMASANVDEFRNYAASNVPAALVRRAPKVAAADNVPTVHPPAAPRPSVAVADVAPSKTTFTPIAPPEAVAVVASAPRVLKPVAAAQVAAAAPPAPAPASEPVALTTVPPRNGFIAEAGAASFSTVSTNIANTPAASIAAALPRTPQPAAEATLWTQTWPYAAIALSLLAIVLTAFAKRGRMVVPSWGAPTVLNNSSSPMGNTDAANTFAHFGAMTEPAPPVPRAQMAYPTVSGETTYDASLDTLLEQIQDVAMEGNVVNDNEIDEQTIRKAWATLANESAVDIGTDSILKAIAQAERELRISPPEPKQAAIDKALDDDLLHDPKPRA